MFSPTILYEEKNEETPGVEQQSSHASSTVEDESFYVSLFCGLSFYKALTIKD
jgi:hypothetical protein